MEENGYYKLASPGVDYDTFRSFETVRQSICGYELVIMNPAGQPFEYSLFSDQACYFIGNIAWVSTFISLAIVYC